MKSNLEQPILDVIFDNKDIIHEHGFIIFEPSAEKQFKLPSGRKIDILTWNIIDDECKVSLIEIKKDEITSRNGIVQAYDYAGELKELLFTDKKIKTIHLDIVLVGYELKDVFALHFMTFQPTMFTYKFNPLTGFVFTQENESQGIVINKHEAVDELLNTIFNH